MAPATTSASARATDTGKPCPDCGARQVAASDSLEWREEQPGRVVVLKGLSGEHCGQCQATWYDARSLDAIMRERQERPVANYEASISKVGGNQLGLYFPKDLRRLFALEPKMKVLITPLSDGAMRLDLPKDESRPLANRMKAIDQTLGL